VPPFWVKRAQREIAGRKIILVTVAGFPLGYNMTETKLDEIKRAIDNGANEVDVVWNVNHSKPVFRGRRLNWQSVVILLIIMVRLLKVIIETAYLSDPEIEKACKLCADAGADFVKTSSGFAPSGAKVENIVLMKKHLPDHVGIKASGGVKTVEQAWH
jgi:deoxyribose-phosphate aldolase